jgi:two-component system chemotaxis response regulator CheY
MKSLFGRTGPARFIRELLSQPSRGEPPILVQSCRTQELTGRAKILIVDDDAVIRKALTLKLESHGFAVTTAMDGADALRALRDENPDLVLLDINFPPDVAHGGGIPWDGFLLMQWMRGIERVGKVPIILITDSDPGNYRERALACGAAGLFHKSLEPEVLISIIERVLSGNGAGGQDVNFQI